MFISVMVSKDEIFKGDSEDFLETMDYDSILEEKLSELNDMDIDSNIIYSDDENYIITKINSENYI